jgi:hypothetical protein
MQPRLGTCSTGAAEALSHTEDWNDHVSDFINSNSVLYTHLMLRE